MLYGDENPSMYPFIEPMTIVIGKRVILEKDVSNVPEKFNGSHYRNNINNIADTWIP
jgi:hypothetical protein